MSRVKAFRHLYQTVVAGILAASLLVACDATTTVTTGNSGSNPVTPSTTLSDNGDGTISDSATGLMWQQATDAYANRSTAASTCSALGLGGYSDWRLPTITELMSIVDYGMSSPAIDDAFFPNTALGEYWTSQSPAAYTSDGLYVKFIQGSVGYKPTSEFFASRCVRGTTLPSANLTDNGDGTVSDSTTGLMWQQCAVGQTGSSCSGTATQGSYQLASSTCASLTLAGHSDWRLPTLRELRFIVDDGAYAPAINSVDFPNTITNYWTSTVVAGGLSYWYINFDDGTTGMNSTTNAKIRCVR